MLPFTLCFGKAVLRFFLQLLKKFVDLCVEECQVFGEHCSFDQFLWHRESGRYSQRDIGTHSHREPIVWEQRRHKREKILVVVSQLDGLHGQGRKKWFEVRREFPLVAPVFWVKDISNKVRAPTGEDCSSHLWKWLS